MEIELSGNTFASLGRDELIMHKPVKVIRNNFNIIRHYFSKTFFICQNKQIYHYDITHLKSIDHLRNVHVTESVQNNESCIRVLLYVWLYQIKNFLSFFSESYWVEDYFDGVGIRRRRKNLANVLDRKDFHFLTTEVFENHELAEENFEDLHELMEVDLFEVLIREYLREETGEEKLKLFSMFIGGRKHKE